MSQKMMDEAHELLRQASEMRRTATWKVDMDRREAMREYIERRTAAVRMGNEIAANAALIEYRNKLSQIDRQYLDALNRASFLRARARRLYFEAKR